MSPLRRSLPLALFSLAMSGCASTPAAAVQSSAALLGAVVVVGIGLIALGAGVVYSALPAGSEPVRLIHRELSALDARNTRTEVSPVLLRWITGMLLVVFGLGLVINVKDEALQAFVAAAAHSDAASTPPTAIEPTTLQLPEGE